MSRRPAPASRRLSSFGRLTSRSSRTGTCSFVSRRIDPDGMGSVRRLSTRRRGVVIAAHPSRGDLPVVMTKNPVLRSQCMWRRGTAASPFALRSTRNRLWSNAPGRRPAPERGCHWRRSAARMRPRFIDRRVTSRPPPLHRPPGGDRLPPTAERPGAPGRSRPGRSPRTVSQQPASAKQGGDGGPANPRRRPAGGGAHP